MASIGPGQVIPPKYKAEATLVKANPVSGTKYTVLDTTKNVRILGIYASVTWTVQPNPLEVHLTIDGEVLTATQANPVSATMYFVSKTSTVSLELSTTDYAVYWSFLIEGRSVKVEVETTGGTTSAVECYVKYQVYD